MLSGEVQTPIFFAYVCVISKFIYIKKMKTNFFKALLCGVAVLFAGSIQAQNEIINADTTTVGAQQVSNQKAGAKVTHRRIKTIRKTAEGADSVIFRSGATEVYADKVITSMTDQELENIVEGRTNAYNLFNHKYDDTPRRNVYAAAVGGIFDFTDVSPLIGGKVGLETMHVDVAFMALFTSSSLPAAAAEAGRFNAQYYLGSITWKALRTKNTYFWVGPKGFAGYGSHQTNSESVDNSRNEGVTYGGGIECRYRLTRWLSIDAEVGALNKVYVGPATNGTKWQKMNNFKPYALLSFGINLFQR
jgi:hypothetical protein